MSPSYCCGAPVTIVLASVSITISSLPLFTITIVTFIVGSPRELRKQSYLTHKSDLTDSEDNSHDLGRVSVLDAQVGAGGWTSAAHATNEVLRAPKATAATGRVLPDRVAGDADRHPI